MGFDTNWDVDYYKTDYESEEHWDLRRSFMSTHKDKFPEDELVCLAQVFTNVEFLGCKYPEETMRKVGILSQDVAAEFRKGRANKLKRTFVGAQDAAGAKAKGKRNNTGESSTAKSAINYKNPVKFVAASTIETTEPTEQVTEKPTIVVNPNKYKAHKTQSTEEPTLLIESPVQRPINSKKIIHQIPPNKYNNLVLFEDNPQKEESAGSILQVSILKNKSQFEYKCTAKNGQHSCVFSMDGQVLCCAEGSTQKEVKELIGELAIKKLRKVCYTIRRKADRQSIHIDLECGKSNTANNIAKSMKSNFVENKLTSENKGFKMMKLLGWMGGALGTASEGIKEPVNVQLKVGRQGLGLGDQSGDEKLNNKYFYNYLQKFLSDENNIHELVFSTEYSKEERATLHKIASRLGLKSNSKNTSDGDRFLTISKKIRPYFLAQNVLNGGIYAEIYDLVDPDTHT